MASSEKVAIVTGVEGSPLSVLMRPLTAPPLKSTENWSLAACAASSGWLTAKVPCSAFSGTDTLVRA